MHAADPPLPFPRSAARWPRERGSMKCCGSRPGGRKVGSGRAAREPSGAAATAEDGLNDVTPVGKRRFRAGQPVVMLEEDSSYAAYKAHGFRNPVTNQSLLELSWETKARPRCGSHGVVAEYNNSEDFVFVLFSNQLPDAGPSAAPEESMLGYYSAGETREVEPALVSVCYQPRTAELMVPQAFRPLGWYEMRDDNREWLSVLGCDESTWEDGEYFPARLKPLEQSWDELSPAVRAAAGRALLNVAGKGGKWLLPNAAEAWDAWCNQRVDAAGRALNRTGAWSIGEWHGLQPLQQAAALCVGMTEACWNKGAPWLCAEDVSPGMPLRVADVATLTGVCRSHPLWERRFSHQWSAIRNMAGCACTVVTVNAAQKTVAVDWDDDEAVDMASATPVMGRKLSSQPQFPFAALESRNPNRPPSMQQMLGYYSATGVFESVEPDLVEVYGTSASPGHEEFELVID